MNTYDQGRPDWWKGAVIYQIYPRSFLDTTGSGTGDLRGIARKLDYVADLGVDAIWISPFVASPMLDFGYDVSDYLAVDPMFGTLDDFHVLLEAAHERGLKVLMDQVLSHTSDQHPWFQESRSSRDNPKADWYVWADATDTGSPPNNWLSVFGGSSWQWEPRRGQYYLHNFLRQQPDLNYHCPEVRRAVLDVCQFWLDLGVDGFRLDVCAFYFHDRDLRDNPPNPKKPEGKHFMFNPDWLQAHKYDIGRPENLDFLQEMRALTDRYDGRVLLGELNQEEGEQLHKSYTADHRLHIAYGYWLLGSEHLSASLFRETARSLGMREMDGWPCWALDNHDFTRSASRFGLERHPESGPVLTAALTLLRGASCLYQGAELSLPEAEVPYDRMADPYGREFFPAYRGRDGARTPMPWAHDAPHAGFSENQPWLPVVEPHQSVAVDLQEAALGSPLNRTRTFLKWRREQPELLRGSMEFLDLPEPLLGIRRSLNGRSIIAILNLSDDAVNHTCSEDFCGMPVHGHGFTALHRHGQLEIPAFGAWFGAES